MFSHVAFLPFVKVLLLKYSFWPDVYKVVQLELLFCFLKTFLFICVCVYTRVCEHMCVYIPTEAGRGHQVTWNWS